MEGVHFFCFSYVPNVFALCFIKFPICYHQVPKMFPKFQMCSLRHPNSTSFFNPILFGHCSASMFITWPKLVSNKYRWSGNAPCTQETPFFFLFFVFSLPSIQCNFEVLETSIYKFDLEICSRDSISSFSLFNCWVQFMPFFQSSQLDVQCMVIARKELAKFPFNAPLRVDTQQIY